jgi:hypothetical protein
VQFAPDLSEAQAVSVLLFAVACPEECLERYCMHNGRLRSRGKTDLSFVKPSTASSSGSSNLLETPAAVDSADKSTKKAAKKAKKESNSNGSSNDSNSSSEWEPTSHDVRKIVLSVLCRAALHRTCAFSVPALISATKNIPQEAAAIVLDAFTSLLDGCIVSRPAADCEVLSSFSDRQVSMGLNWVEALLDSHYSGFAMALSASGAGDKDTRVVQLASTVLRKLFTITSTAEQTLSELEAAFGLWTHVSRSNKSGNVNINELGLSGVLTLGGAAGAVYQVETLEL